MSKIYDYCIKDYNGGENRGFKLNTSAIIALIAGVLIVICTQGNFSSVKMLLQPEAFFIVLGGTFCATVLNYSPTSVVNAFKAAKNVFVKSEYEEEKILKEIIDLANKARRKGIFSIYEQSKNIKNSFLKRGVQLAIDVENPQLLYDVMESDISYDEEQEIINSRIFEAMGGYAPTFGIVGAVLGLIKIMSNLQSLDAIGIGIATAFVSTLYGVGVANLVFLPIAGNLKSKTRERILLKEVILQGIMAIQMQENPTVLEEKLIAYLKYHNKPQTLKNKNGVLKL